MLINCFLDDTAELGDFTALLTDHVFCGPALLFFLFILLVKSLKLLSLKTILMMFS